MARKRRSLPAITSDIPRDLRRFTDRVREIVTGDGPDRLTSAQELRDSGIAVVDSGGNLLPGRGAASSCLPPPAPTALAAHGAMTSVILEWAGTNYPCHSHTEIWRAGVDDLAEAVMVGQSNGFMYADAVGTGGAFYYWVRFRNTQDVAGAFNAVAGTDGATSPDPEYLIDQLTGDGPYQPIFLVPEPTEINGVPVPAGVYVKDAWIANGSIGNAKIGHAAIDTAKIADAAIVAAKIQDATITGAKIGTAQIATAHIQLAAITAALIQDATITDAKIANATITGAKIGAAEIDTANIKNAAIKAALIDNAAIGTAKIQDLAVTDAKIANAAITTAKIGNLQVTDAKIANAAIGTAKIDNAAITTAKIGDLQVTGAKIASATITDANIGSLNAGKINAGTMSGDRIAANTLDANRLIVSTMAARLALIGTAYIGTANIGDTAVTTLKIGNNAVIVPVSGSAAGGSYGPGTLSQKMFVDVHIPHGANRIVVLLNVVASNPGANTNVRVRVRGHHGTVMWEMSVSIDSQRTISIHYSIPINPETFTGTYRVRFDLGNNASGGGPWTLQQIVAVVLGVQR